jgi:phosphoenolpyruvate synthase/pyruvate phosphate dikinase
MLGVDRDSELVAHLVAEGIDSISLNPDSVLKTMVAIVEAEKGAASAGARAMAETSR